jgi:hypothetical protein
MRLNRSAFLPRCAHYKLATKVSATHTNILDRLVTGMTRLLDQGTALLNVLTQDVGTRCSNNSLELIAAVPCSVFIERCSFVSLLAGSVRKSRFTDP